MLGFLGVKGGLREAKQPKAEDRPATVEIAGALVDSSSVKTLAGELAGQAIAITAQTAAIKEQTEEMEEGRHSYNRLREAIDRLTTETARK